MYLFVRYTYFKRIFESKKKRIIFNIRLYLQQECIFMTKTCLQSNRLRRTAHILLKLPKVLRTKTVILI